MKLKADIFNSNTRCVEKLLLRQKDDVNALMKGVLIKRTVHYLILK